MATHAVACARLHAPASPLFNLRLYRVLRRFVGPVLCSGQVIPDTSIGCCTAVFRS